MALPTLLSGRAFGDKSTGHLHTII